MVLPGSDTSAVEPHPSHINVSKGAQYSLTDAVTGRIVHPRKIVRVKKNLEITLLDGTVVHLDDFFASLEGQDGVNQAKADFIFSTEEGGLQYWNISDAGTAFDASSLHAGVEEAVTLWSHDSTMNMSQWLSVAPYEASKISADGQLGISVASVLGAFLVSSIGVIEAGDPVVKTELTE